MNTINICIVCATVLLSVGIIVYFFNKLITRKYNQRDFELELEKYKFFGSVDTKKVQEELDNLINKYFAYYVLYNFEALNKNYIKEDEMTQAIKDITKNIVIEMSELYSFYFKMLYDIESEEQLTAKIHEMVTDTMIAYAADFNRPKEREEESRA